MNRQRHPHFEELMGTPDPNAVCIPELRLNLRNDCKVGGWFVGAKNYGARLEFIALKFTRRIANADISFITPGTLLGELWLLPVGGGVGSDEYGNEIEIPKNTVFYTLLKNSRQHETKRDTGTGTLVNFGEQVMLLASQGYDYREVIWKPIFRKKEGKAVNGDPLSYYIIDWQYILPESQSDKLFNRVGDAINFLQRDSANLFDPAIETTTVSIDGMPREDLQVLLASLHQGQKVIAAAE